MLTLLLAAASCGGDAARNAEADGDEQTAPATRSPASESWAPRTRTSRGLRMFASADANGFQLNVRKGSVSFLPGINLGATTPGRQPGELAIESDDYRRWFA